MNSITADQVAALRAALKGDADGHKRIYAGLEPTSKDSYGALIVAAFFRAAERRFAEGGNKTDVVAFVANLRAQHELEDDIDPRIAERLLMATFSDEEIDDIPDNAKGGHYMLLLAGLIADAQLSDIELDEFLADARKLADEWFS
jgi:hypothetical protein